MSTFQDKIIWITGASRGIGRELCYQLAQLGATLIVSARNEVALRKLVSELPRSDEHLILPLNLGELPADETLHNIIFSRFIRVDILINNAGIMEMETIAAGTMAVQRETMEVNYFGNIALSKLLLSHWQVNQPGRIVVISSLASLSGFYRLSAYCASKKALHGFYESLMLEEKDRVQVHLICPGSVATPYEEDSLRADGSRRIVSRIPKTMISVESCAQQICAVLATNRPLSYIGGTELRMTALKRWLPSSLFYVWMLRKGRKLRFHNQTVSKLLWHEMFNFDSNMKSFQGKVAWVTGASSGIGEETARQLAAAGARLILSARNKASLEHLLATLPNPESHLVLPLDLEQSEHFPELAAQVIARFGRIDLLVNNGGLSQRSEAVNTSLEVDRRIMEINYFGNIALSKAVLPYMQQQKAGHIVVISSISGKFGFYLRSAYSASKHALHGFYESLLLEESPNNIRVTIVCPGKINTPISTNALTGDGRKHGVMDHNQSTGMPVSVCVERMLAAVKKEKKEVLIGNKEIKAVTLKRFFPKLFWKIIAKQSAT